MKNIFAAALLLAFTTTSSYARFAPVRLGLRSTTLVTAPALVVPGTLLAQSLTPTLPSLYVSALVVPAAVAIKKTPIRTSVQRAAAPAPQRRSPGAASRHWTGFFDGIQGKSAPTVVVNAADTPSRPQVATSVKEKGLVGREVPVPGNTALQKHVSFFDRNGDGIITVSETRFRLRQLGFSWTKSAFLSFVIHAGLAKSTSASWTDALLLRLSVEKMHLGIHAADTGIYDEHGNFVPEAFKRLFADHAKTDPAFLTESEFQNMITANAKRRPGALGKFAAKQEFGLLLDIASDGKLGEERTISRSRMEGFYDGTLLYTLVGER
ncbi:MAG: hypothetical protein COB53_00505 [Elusimicrobia bacterium]|nr:MAG: hypothetical protein COB53_00505 [Elusimicrobiota bacterium]